MTSSADRPEKRPGAYWLYWMYFGIGLFLIHAILIVTLSDHVLNDLRLQVVGAFAGVGVTATVVIAIRALWFRRPRPWVITLNKFDVFIGLAFAWMIPAQLPTGLGYLAGFMASYGWWAHRATKWYLNPEGLTGDGG